MNSDYSDMLSRFNEEDVEYLVVGAFALSAHGLLRSTGDIDLWIRPTTDNAQRVWKALLRFGAPLLDLTLNDLAIPDIVFQIGVAPRRIDILTSIAGVDFDECWLSRKEIVVDGIKFAVIGREHLLVNKKAAGRPKYLADAAWLESSDDDD